MISQVKFLNNVGKRSIVEKVQNGSQNWTLWNTTLKSMFRESSTINRHILHACGRAGKISVLSLGNFGVGASNYYCFINLGLACRHAQKRRRHILSFLHEDATLVHLVCPTWRCLPPDKYGDFTLVYAEVSSPNVWNSSWSWSVVLYILTVSTAFCSLGLLYSRQSNDFLLKVNLKTNFVFSLARLRLLGYFYEPFSKKKLPFYPAASRNCSMPPQDFLDPIFRLVT